MNTRERIVTKLEEVAATIPGDDLIAKFRGGIATKFAIIFSLLVLVATGTVGYMVYQGAEESLITSSSERLEHTAEIIEVRLKASIEAITKDVHFLASTPPVHGIVRARVEGERDDQAYIDPATFIDDQEWLTQLADLFEVFLRNRPSYLQASFVGVAEDGRELVRVEKQQGDVSRVPASELQTTSAEAYFDRVTALPSGTLYLSEIKPPSDEGDNAHPVAPTLYATTPIYASNGEVFGFIMIQVDVRPTLDAFRSLADPNITLYLANERGDFLIHPDVTDSFDHALSEAPPWFDNRSDHVLIEQLDVGNEVPTIAYFERMNFGSEEGAHYLTLGVTSPRETILTRVTSVRNRSLLITLLFCLAGIVLALSFSQYLTRPLRQVTQALSRFGRDTHDGEQPSSVDLPTHRRDEIGVLARAFDAMTQQIQHQMQELEDKEHRQRIILETSAEGIIVINETGDIEAFNRTAERLLKYEADTVIGYPIDMMLSVPPSPDEDDASPEEALPWMTTGSGWEVIGRTKDGTTLPLSLAVSAFELSGEQKFALFLQDISERKRYEEALQQAKEQAEEIARLKSAFLANMSHEIRTPLTTVIGYASVLAREASEKHRKFAHLIKRSAERLMDTLNSVLSLAQLEANRMDIELDVLHITDETEEIVQLFQPLAQKKELDLQFVAQPDAEDAQAHLDRGALTSVLQNLIGNAIKFTERGHINVMVEADAQTVHIHVEDTGIGIDEEFIPRLFDEFIQESTGVNRSHEGSGLGLAITRRLVELMDGRISVQSEKGEGTTFTITFPRSNAESPNGQVSDTPTAVQHTLSTLPRIKLLLVEDNTEAAMLIQDILHDACEVTTASNAEEALRKAREATYDIVLMDINLGGGLSGSDVLSELRTHAPYAETPIVAMTAYALPGDRERFLDMGFTTYLSKPFTPEELQDLIAELLAPAN